ncbi:MAG: hypothetical protein RLZZ241_1047, partial [Bacteroidota bacterium]
FPKDKSFVKLGNIYSLIRHEFSIEAAGISKTSNIVTRNLEVIEAEFSKIKIEEKALMKEIEKITFGQSSRKPLQCEAASFPNLDFHSVGEGDTLEYRCLYNIKNYGNTNSVSSVIYEKTYLLTNQYITTPCQ